MLVSTRSKDMVSEKAIGDFLHKYFYTKLFNDCETIEDVDRQVSGIDEVADGMLIDNKAMSSPGYINNPSKTFITELLTHSKTGEPYLGWFLNNNLKTTHYLFVWIWNANVPRGAYITNENQIKRLEVMLIDRQKLHELINKHCSDKRLLAVAKDMVARSERSRNISEFGYYNCPHFVHSTDLKEKPVNLVNPKWFLSQAAIKHCYVTPTEIFHLNP